MGVLNLKDDKNIIDVLDNEKGGETIDNRLPPAQVKKPKKKYNYFMHDRASPSKRKEGVRRARRSENLTCLLALLEGQEDNCDLYERDFTDVAEPSSSVFSELFNEQEKMKIWNDFVNSSEEEQERMLVTHQVCQEISEDKWEEEAMEKDGFTIIDKRQVHPSFSASECFKQINSSLRSLLQKRHLPLGALTHLEEEVIGFFSEWPTSIYIAKLDSSYQRLLMHAICQYLSLSSRSFDDDHGQRQTQVENKNSQFQAPDVSLSCYLSQLQLRLH